MYAIFDLTRRYGNENGNGRSAASGTLRKFFANKRQGFTFCVTVDYWSNILRINYSHVESQEFNLNLHNTTWRLHATSAKVHAAGVRSQRPNSFPTISIRLVIDQMSEVTPSTIINVYF